MAYETVRRLFKSRTRFATCANSSSATDIKPDRIMLLPFLRHYSSVSLNPRSEKQYFRFEVRT